MAIFARETVTGPQGETAGRLTNCSVESTGTPQVGGTFSITADYTAQASDGREAVWTIELVAGGRSIVTDTVTVTPDGINTSITGSITPQESGTIPVDLNVTNVDYVASGGPSVAPLSFVSGYVGTLSLTTEQETTFHVTVENSSNEAVFAGVAIYVDGERQGTSQTNIPPGQYQFSVPRLGQNMPVGDSMSVEAELVAGTDEFSDWERGERKQIGTVSVVKASDGTDDTGDPDEGGDSDSDIGDGPGTCPDGYQWSESIQDCIPTCPDGQYYVPGSGCIGNSAAPAETLMRFNDKTRVR